MQNTTPRFQAWLEAEKAADAAERELHAAMLDYCRGQSGPPSEGRIASARALRAEAHRLFDEGMREMKELAESLHYRRIVTKGSTGPSLPGEQQRTQ